MKIKFISALLCLGDTSLASQIIEFGTLVSAQFRKMNGSEFKVSMSSRPRRRPEEPV